MKSSTIFTVIVLFLLNVSAIAQNSIISGQITVFDSIPLKGIIIQVKGLDQDFISDYKGNFAIPCKPGDKLTFTGEGFYKEIFKIQSEINPLEVNMKIKPGSKNIKQALAYLPIISSEQLNQFILAEEADKYEKYKDMYELVKKEFPGKLLAYSSISHYPSTFIIDDVIKDKDEFFALSPADIKKIYFMNTSYNSTLKDEGSAIVVITKSAKSDPNILINGTEKYMSRKF